MTDEWTEKKITDYITNEVEESLILDYKDSRSLGKSDGKKSEITKDVSAMANSAGGVLLYGVSEYQNSDRTHLPEKITPIDQSEFSKEWLEQIISNIRPKIPDVKIHPVPVKSGFVYVVEIPQSSLGHQAKDKRYYKRYNFESVAMEDYELKDILSRRSEPKFEIQFKFTFEDIDIKNCQISVKVKNTGDLLAEHICLHIDIPYEFFPDYIQKIATEGDISNIMGTKYYRTVITNLVHAYNYGRDRGFMGITGGDIASSYYHPILPGLDYEDDVEIDINVHRKTSEVPIYYTIFADNAKPVKGNQFLQTIPKILDGIG